MIILTFRSAFNDINFAYNERLEEARTEIEKCTSEYTRNNCFPELRVEALEEYCAKREVCMRIPPEQRAKYMDAVSNYIADSASQFTSRLTWQGLIFVIAIAYIFVKGL